MSQVRSSIKKITGYSDRQREPDFREPAAPSGRSTLRHSHAEHSGSQQPSTRRGSSDVGLPSGILRRTASSEHIQSSDSDNQSATDKSSGI